MLLLLESKRKLDRENNAPETPLYYALIGGHERIMRVLLDNGALVESLQISRSRISFYFAQAVTEGKEVTLKVSIRLKADIWNNAGQTFLTQTVHTAIDNAMDVRSLSLICFLLRNGANPNQRNKNSLTPLEIAFQFNTVRYMIAIATTLVAMGADWKLIKRSLGKPYITRRNSKEVDVFLAFIKAKERFPMSEDLRSFFYSYPGEFRPARPMQLDAQQKIDEMNRLATPTAENVLSSEDATQALNASTLWPSYLEPSDPTAACFRLLLPLQLGNLQLGELERLESLFNLLVVDHWTKLRDEIIGMGMSGLQSRKMKR